MKILERSFILLAIFSLAACSAPEAAENATRTPTVYVRSMPTLTINPANRSLGGGEPRSTSYCEMWSTCGRNSQATQAAANGGREEGWILLDDLLQDPGVQVGNVNIGACQEALDLLLEHSLESEDRAGDAAYQLASQLVTAELNLGAGAAYCPAVDGAVIAAQTLLASANFDGRGRYWEVDSGTRQAAQGIVGQLQRYNSGTLCR